MTEQDCQAVEVLSALFAEHVDIEQLLADLEEASARPADWVRELPLYPQ